MTRTIDPDDIANAARRISANLVADQANDIIMSIVGQSGPDLDLESPHVAVVVVARKRHMVAVLHWLTREKPKEVTVVGGDDKLSPMTQHRRSVADELVAAVEQVLTVLRHHDVYGRRLTDALAAFKAAQ